jgi:hypothetical protein
MPNTQRPGNTGIVPPYIRDRIAGTSAEVREGIAATQLRGALVELNKKGKVGTRTLTFKIGSKSVQTDEALRALQSGKQVRATVVQFKTARTSKLTGGGYFKAKVRVPRINIATLDSVKDLQAFAKANVLDFNKSVKSGG